MTVLKGVSPEMNRALYCLREALRDADVHLPIDKVASLHYAFVKLVEESRITLLFEPADPDTAPIEPDRMI